MWDWLLAPIDPGRAHDISVYAAWHGRAMTLGWGVIAPLAVLVARFFKILPGQDWPRELDHHFWWRSHWIGQSVVCALTAIGFALAVSGDFATMSVHGWLGYGVVLGLLAQIGLGLARGSKGGPTDMNSTATSPNVADPAAAIRGHHYDMTPRRRFFEAAHKSLGYGALLLGATTILFGLWRANAPRWMWLALIIWWSALVAAFIVLQRRGMAVDTYQAIWGDDPAHPGNRLPKPGWWVRRPGDDAKEGDADVR